MQYEAYSETYSGIDVMLVLVSSAVAEHMTNKRMVLHVLQGGLSTVAEITAGALVRMVFAIVPDTEEFRL